MMTRKRELPPWSPSVANPWNRRWQQVKAHEIVALVPYIFCTRIIQSNRFRRLIRLVGDNESLRPVSWVCFRAPTLLKPRFKRVLQAYRDPTGQTAKRHPSGKNR